MENTREICKWIETSKDQIKSLASTTYGMGSFELEKDLYETRTYRSGYLLGYLEALNNFENWIQNET